MERELAGPLVRNSGDRKLLFKRAGVVLSRLKNACIIPQCVHLKFIN